MAKIDTLTPKSAGIQARAVVTGDGEMAAASNRRRQKAIEGIISYSNSLDERFNAARDADFYSQNVNDAELQYRQMYEQVQRDRMNNPDGVGNELSESIRKDIDARVEQARTPELKRQLNDRLTGRLTHYSTSALTWENNRKVQIFDGNYKDRSRDRLDRIKNGENADAIYQEWLDDLEGAQEWMPKERTLAEMDVMKEGIYGTSAEYELLKNPTGVLQKINSGGYDGKLNKMQIEGVRKKAQRAIDALLAHRRAAVKDKLSDAMAYTRTTGNIPPGLLVEVENVFGTEEAKQVTAQLLMQKDIYEATDNMQRLPMSDIADMINHETKALESGGVDGFRARSERLNALRNAASAIQKSRDESPYLHAVRSNPTLRDGNLDDIIHEQQIQGVASYDVSVMPPSTAEGVVEQIANETDPVKIKDTLTGIKQHFGDKYYGYAINDLIRAGMPQEYAITSLIPRTNAQEQRLSAMAATKKLSDYKKINPEYTPTKVGEVAELVRKNMGDYLNSYGAGYSDSEYGGKMVEHSTKMAMEAMLRGSSKGDAAKRATSWLTEQYDYYDSGNGFKLRIPKEDANGGLRDTRKAWVGADSYKRNLVEDSRTVFDIPVPMGDESVVRTVVGRDSYWATNANDDKLYLMYEGVNVSQIKDGKSVPIVVDIDSLTRETQDKEVIKTEVKSESSTQEEMYNRRFP